MPLISRSDAPVVVETLSLDHLSDTAPGLASPASSESSDLSSHAEDKLAFTSPEDEDLRREKRRKMLDTAHAERLQARQVEDGDELSWDPHEQVSYIISASRRSS